MKQVDRQGVSAEPVQVQPRSVACHKAGGGDAHGHTGKGHGDTAEIHEIAEEDVQQSAADTPQESENNESGQCGVCGEVLRSEDPQLEGDEVHQHAFPGPELDVYETAADGVGYSTTDEKLYPGWKRMEHFMAVKYNARAKMNQGPTPGSTNRRNAS